MVVCSALPLMFSKGFEPTRVQLLDSHFCKLLVFPVTIQNIHLRNKFELYPKVSWWKMVLIADGSQDIWVYLIASIEGIEV